MFGLGKCKSKSSLLIKVAGFFFDYITPPRLNRSFHLRFMKTPMLKRLQSAFVVNIAILALVCLGVTLPSPSGAHEIDPKQNAWYQKYKGQENAPEPDEMLLNTDAEPELGEGFEPMFNAKDLTGWTPQGGQCRFEVVDHEIVGTCVPGSPSTYLCTDKSDYTDFIFTCEMKWDIDGNSGVMFRSQSKPGKNDVTVYGPQAEMEGTSGDRYWNGGVYGQSCGGYFYPLWLTEHEAARAALNRDGWNRLTIQANGNVVQTWVNGVPAAKWVDDGTYPKGFFGLQVHAGKQGQMRWKNLRVKELTGTQVDTASSTKLEKPLKVLLVAGGCCHDYASQTKLLKDGIESRINANVTVVLSDDKSTKTTFDIYNSDDWAKGYDVVIHDECSADVTERPYVERILNAHRNGVPAVNLHCAMHSYRWGDFRSPVKDGADNADWYEMIGVQSTSHGPQRPIELSHTNSEHPITKGLEDWTTINEELYNNVRVLDGTTGLIQGDQELSADNKQSAVVAWTNLYGPDKTRIFSTSLGHQNQTVADDRYLDLVVRGLLWVTGNLQH